MSVDWTINGSVVIALCVQLVGIVAFLVRAADRSARAENAANELQRELRKVEDKVALENASLSLFREQVARDYVSREAMREMEDRLVGAIDRLGDRLDRVIDQRPPRSSRPA